jgi:lactate dehydrogenase-like 2-hydroxyacid dehydrogenase
MSKLLATGPALPDHIIRELEALKFEVTNVTRDLSQEEFTDLLRDKDAYIFGGFETATAEALNQAPNLKIVAFLGTGYEELVDTDAATKAGIAVTNTPEATAAAVAEMTMGLLLALQRRIPGLNRATKSGSGSPTKLRNIAGRRLGIIGLGAIGSRVAAHARKGFDMDVVYAGPHPKPGIERSLGVARVSLEDLLSTSDFVSLHCPGAETVGLLSKDKINLMKPGAFLINTVLPEVVDGPSIIDALQTDRLAGAAFDGFYKEPQSLMTEFLAIPDEKLIVLPRTAWLTEESLATMAAMAVANIRALLDGSDPPNLVNPTYTHHGTV